MTVLNQIRKGIEELERVGISRVDMRMNISPRIIVYLKFFEGLYYLNSRGVGRGGIRQTIEGVVIEAAWPFNNKVLIYHKDASWEQIPLKLTKTVILEMNALEAQQAANCFTGGYIKK